MALNYISLMISDLNTKRTKQHITNKMSKNKDKEIILKAAREKALITYERTFLRLPVAFSLECFSPKAVALYTQSAERKTSQPTVVYLGKLSFRIEEFS